MGGSKRRLAGLAVVGLVAVGLTGVAPSSAGAAGCTTVLTSESSYTGTSGDDVVCVDGVGDYTVDTGSGNDIVKVMTSGASVEATLGDGADVFTGSLATTSTVDAGAGADRVTTGNGDDTVDAGDGDDVVATKAGDDAVTGGDGNDRIVTGTGSDTVDAGAGDDKVSTQEGDDTVVGGTGADNVNGGPDDDRVDGGPGPDKLAGSIGDDDLAGGDDADRVAGGPGEDTLDGGAGPDLVGGSAGIDAVSGGDGADILSGGDGDDGFDGLAGDTAAAGAGDVACSNSSELQLACARGAVVVSVDHTVEETATGWLVTVRARALDFQGGGVTLIKIAESATDPGTGSVPVLVDGTRQNGVYEATFELASAPASGHLGVRVFTTGFSVDGWIAHPFGIYTPNSWPCVSNWTTIRDVDVDCGQFNGVGGVIAGFPKTMRSIEIPGAAGDPTFTAYSGTTAEVHMGAQTTVYAYGGVAVPRQTPLTDWVHIFNYYASAPAPSTVWATSGPPPCAPPYAGFFGLHGTFQFTLRAFVIVDTASGGQAWYAHTLPDTASLKC
ncbi:MAG: calcium-binding protein [Actinomycetes bacterium]